MENKLAKPFIIILVVVALFVGYKVLQPFLIEILIATVLSTLFYGLYERLVRFFKGRRNISALLMCLVLMAVLIIPTVKLLIFAGEKSVEAYSQTVEFFQTHTPGDIFARPEFQSFPLNVIDWHKYDNASFQNVVLDVFKSSSDWMISGATTFVKGTTNFVISLVLIIITMFFFFVDGKNMVDRLMRLSPLPDKYDEALFKKFKDVSRTTILSTFVTAGAQGLVGAVGFAIVGFPVFLAGVLVALLSLIPYLGSMIFYLPVAIYYILVGDIWQGIFIILWGALVIGNVDNIIRAYMIKGKAQINPIFVILSILGGVVLFGFWGVVIGPLLIALAVTIFHIYEMEFCYDKHGEYIEGEKDAQKLKKIAKENAGGK